jgi:NADH:ubiquinone oxidoreductase subunit 4 (subunit M)
MWGSFLSSLVAATQGDIKSLVAYSSVSHMGIILTGVLVFSQIRVFGSFIIILTHGFCSSALFFIVGRLYEKTYTRQILIQSGSISLCFGLSF